MELRQLTTEYEREAFSRCVEEARATRGLRFRETQRSRLGRAHLACGSLYALFENQGESDEKMIAGFRLHDLATLPQSFPKPDLSHSPARFVLEGGELWSLSRGAGRVARVAAGAIVGIRQARAMVIYAIGKPLDITQSYADLGFVRVGKLIEWPFAETVEKGKIWVQGMVIEGENLENWVRSGYEAVFQTSENCRAVRFENPFRHEPQPSSAVLRMLITAWSTLPSIGRRLSSSKPSRSLRRRRTIRRISALPTEEPALPRARRSRMRWRNSRAARTAGLLRRDWRR